NADCRSAMTVHLANGTKDILAPVQHPGNWSRYHSSVLVCARRHHPDFYPQMVGRLPQRLALSELFPKKNQAALAFPCRPLRRMITTKPPISKRVPAPATRSMPKARDVYFPVCGSN